MKKKKIIIALVVLVALIAVFIGVFKLNQPKTNLGSKSYTVTVTDADGNVTTFEGTTDQEYLSGLMDELSENSDFSYEGYDSDYGLYITAIDGVTADYDADGAYWSIYVNGEYGSYGADQQPVADGDEFGFVYEVYNN